VDEEEGKANDPEHESFDEQETFFEHYDIEKIVTLKCIAVSCNKLRDRKFLLK